MNTKDKSYSNFSICTVKSNITSTFKPSLTWYWNISYILVLLLLNNKAYLGKCLLAVLSCRKQNFIQQIRYLVKQLIVQLLPLFQLVFLIFFVCLQQTSNFHQSLEIKTFMSFDRYYLPFDRYHVHLAI